MTCPSRPTEYDEDVKAIAVAKLMVKIAEWSQGDIHADDKEAADEVAECINESDGYAIASRLDLHYHWSCDSDLVEIMDGAASILSDTCRDQTRKWVDGWGITPSHAVGDHVTWKSNDAEITATDNTHVPGSYTLFIPAAGHVRNGLGTHGEFIAWERIDGKINAGGLTVAGPLFTGERL